MASGWVWSSDQAAIILHAGAASKRRDGAIAIRQFIVGFLGAGTIMLVLMRCVAEAVMTKGIRGLTELVPGGAFLYDVSMEALRRLRERKVAAQLREEVRQVAAASFQDARWAAEQVAREVVAAATPIEDRIALELYLTQMPACVRQSMKRADDPTGKTVPAGFALEQPEDLARMLPSRVPKFRPGDGLPGRSGWTLHELLGAGGFGEVWLARHAFIPNPRAVKFCTDPQARAKLASHEGKVIARVMDQGHHPNIVALLDAVLDGDAPWLMYEYVGGGNLTDLIHRWQGIPPADRERCVVAAMYELSEAVAAFHRLAPPIVHRDLKPSNILLTVHNGRDKDGGGKDIGLAVGLRITDFGIGGVAMDGATSRMSSPSAPVSGWLETSLRGSYTPLYASPQQRAGSPPDPRDDVHALGVIGYQLTTGRLDQAPGIDAADDLRDAGAGGGLIQILTRCVAHKPERRPRDGEELAQRLDELRRPQRPLVVVPPVLAAPAQPEIELPPPPAARTIEPASRLLPFIATLYSRLKDDASSGWTRRSERLPGNVELNPGEAYRIAFSSSETTDESLESFRSASFSGLEAIDLSGCSKVTDAGLACLIRIPELVALNLSFTGISDSGAVLLLSRFPDLEAVSLEGLDRISQTIVPYLLRLRKLKRVLLPPRVDTVDVRLELSRRLPGCRIA
jgi:serine/threonine protein kinase